MNAQLEQPILSAERRLFHERRRFCALEYSPRNCTGSDARSGFDRRLVIRLHCRLCGKLLFATRDADHRVILSPRFYEFASQPEVTACRCPCCGGCVDRAELQQQQEELLREKLRFE